MSGRVGVHRRRWVVAVTVVVLAALSVAVAAVRDGDDQATSGPRAGCSVLLIGDSLTVDSRDQAGYPDCWVVDARNGRSTAQGADVARAHRADRFAVVLIALGTNDGPDTRSSYRAEVDRLLDAIGPRPRVGWINVDTGAPALTSLGDVNEVLAGTATRHPRLTVADWNGYLRARGDARSLRDHDGIHYRPAGSRVRRDFDLRLVRRIGP